MSSSKAISSLLCVSGHNTKLKCVSACLKESNIEIFQTFDKRNNLEIVWHVDDLSDQLEQLPKLFYMNAVLEFESIYREMSHNVVNLKD